MSEKTESQIRFEVRTEWREEAVLTKYRDYPLDSLERMIAIDEGQKIILADQMSAQHGY